MATKVNPGTDENEVKLDFRGLEARREGGKAAKVPPGDYLLEVLEAKNVAIESGQNAGKRQIAWKFEIKDAKSDDPEAQAGIGDTVYLNTMVDPASKGLWFLRNLLADLTGTDATGATLSLRLDDKKGKQVGATLQDGRPYDKVDKDTGEVTTIVRSEIKYTYPASRYTGVVDAPQQAAPAEPKASANGKATTPQQAAAAVSEADEDEDMEELAIQSL